MTDKKTQLIVQQHAEELDKINQQRRTWLYASSVVVLATVFLIFGWDWLGEFHSKSVWWLTASVILILSVNWWYWTMRVVLRLLHHQKTEFHIISELVVELKEIRKDIKQLGNHNIDKQY